MIDESQIRQEARAIVDRLTPGMVEREPETIATWVADWVISLTRTVAVNAMETARDQAAQLFGLCDCGGAPHTQSCQLRIAEKIRANPLPTELTERIAAQRAEAAREARDFSGVSNRLQSALSRFDKELV